jgi:hypothetical protein
MQLARAIIAERLRAANAHQLRPRRCHHVAVSIVGAYRLPRSGPHSSA